MGVLSIGHVREYWTSDTRVKVTAAQDGGKAECTVLICSENGAAVFSTNLTACSTSFFGPYSVVRIARFCMCLSCSLTPSFPFSPGPNVTSADRGGGTEGSTQNGGLGDPGPYNPWQLTSPFLIKTSLRDWRLKQMSSSAQFWNSRQQAKNPTA